MTIEGVDLWEARGTVDFQRVKEAGKRFLTLRGVTSGLGVDARYNEYAAGAVEHELPYLTWHLFDPYKSVDAHLEKILRVFIPGPMPDALDAERRGILTRSKLTDRVCSIGETLGQQLGYQPLLYANYDYLENLFNDPARIARAFRIWLAWPSSSPTFRQPRGYPAPVLWQHDWAGAVPGVNGPALLTRFLGDEAAFGRFCSIDLPALTWDQMSEAAQDDLTKLALQQLGILDVDGRPLV